MELGATLGAPKPSRTRTRASTRRPLSVRGRISWKDQHGTTRIANVTTRNASHDAVYVEWQERSAITMYRLVQFQVSSEARQDPNLPDALRLGKVLSAVVRVGDRRPATGAPAGFAPRLLVDPRRKPVHGKARKAEDAERLTDATAIA